MTFLFASLTTFTSTGIGILCAWLVTRTDLPFAKSLKTALSLPYAIPPFIGAIAWIYLFNPTAGLFNQLLSMFISENLKWNIYSLTGLIFIESTFLYTFVFITLCTQLKNIDSSLEEAAKISGASSLKTFFYITLPLIRPSVFAAGIMVFVTCLASFGVPALIAGPAGFKVLTTEIFQLQKMGTTSALKSSIYISSLLMIFTIALFFIQKIFMQKSFAVVTGKSNRPSLVKLGHFKWLVFSLIVSFILIVLGMPFFSLLISALSQKQGEFSFAQFGVQNFKRILLETDELSRAFKNSIFIGASTALASSFIALILGYIQTQTKFRIRSLSSFAVQIPFAIPGTVIALALIISFSQSFFGLPFSIYNTATLFILAYLMKYLHFSFKVISESYTQIHPNLIEAAKTSGASITKILRSIWLPLLLPSILASFFLVFIPSLTELTMSVFLTGPQLETLGTMIFQLQEYSDNIGGGSAVLSLFVFIFILIMNFLIKLVSKGRFGL